MPSGSLLPVMLMMRPHLRSIIWSSSAVRELALAGEIQRDRLVPLRVGRFERELAAAAGVVDQDVHAAQALQRRLAIVAARPRSRVLHSMMTGFCPRFFRQLLQQVAPARHDREAHAFARQRHRDAAADAHARAGDQRGLAAMPSSIEGGNPTGLRHGNCVGIPHWQRQSTFTSWRSPDEPEDSLAIAVAAAFAVPLAAQASAEADKSIVAQAAPEKKPMQPKDSNRGGAGGSRPRGDRRPWRRARPHHRHQQRRAGTSGTAADAAPSRRLRTRSTRTATATSRATKARRDLGEPLQRARQGQRQPPVAKRVRRDAGRRRRDAAAARERAALRSPAAPTRRIASRARRSSK